MKEQICRFCKKSGIYLMRHSRKNDTEYYMTCKDCQCARKREWYRREGNDKKQQLYNKNYIMKTKAIY